MPSKIWTRIPLDLMRRTQTCIDTACDQIASRQSGYIFFRADDVAVPGNHFARLMEIFSKYRVPLCLAVVPAWLTAARWQALKRIGKNRTSLCCWHQHGWRHINHQKTGKKQEFGSFRTRAALERDLLCGKRRLENLIGNNFYAVFSPPWNRCDDRTLQLLKGHGYVAVSRNCGSRPPALKELPDYYVNVDLHTRKEHDSTSGWNNLFVELKRAVSFGCCGILLHHQRMNSAAFDFLETFLKMVVIRKELQLVNFKDFAQLS